MRYAYAVPLAPTCACNTRMLGTQYSSAVTSRIRNSEGSVSGKAFAYFCPTSSKLAKGTLPNSRGVTGPGCGPRKNALSSRLVPISKRQPCEEPALIDSTGSRGRKPASSDGRSGKCRGQESFTGSWPRHFPLRPSLEAGFLPRLPVESIKAGSSQGCRLLIGTNRDESAFFLGPHPGPVTPRELGNVPLASFDEVGQKYAKAFPDTDPSLLRIREVTAEEYWVPSMRVLQAHVGASGTAYAYRMDWTRNTGHLAGFAYHSLELALVWATAEA